MVLCNLLMDYKKQAATQYNEALVARSSEYILSKKLFNALIQLTDVHRVVKDDRPDQMSRPGRGVIY
eukprot:COSAG01_NODE_27517_length_683_cov_258.577055_1_plen_67_part_00